MMNWIFLSEYVFPSCYVHSPTSATFLVNQTHSTIAKEVSNSVSLQEVKLSSSFVSHLQKLAYFLRGYPQRIKLLLSVIGSRLRIYWFASLFILSDGDVFLQITWNWVFHDLRFDSSSKLLESKLIVLFINV